MAIALTHVSLLVADVQKAMNFYQDALGLEVIENFGNYATLRANENLKLSFFPYTAIIEALPSIHAARSGYRTVLEFQVEKLDDLYTKLKEKDIQFVSQPTDYPDWGIRTAYFKDLDDNLVELFSPLE